MKKNIFLTAVALTALGLVLACTKETSAPEEQPIDSQVEVTTNPSIIKAGIPDAITKVALSDKGVGSGMSLAWEAGDELRVIATAGGSGNEAFSIKEGFTATSAEFEGTPVEGTAFTVFYPGSYADVAAINARSYTSQVQIGNANTDHLEWNAIESGIADYSTVSFSSKQNGALRFHLQLPAAFTKVYKVALKTPSAIFSTTNAGDATTDELILTLKADGSTPGITLGGDKVLTAYLMVSWNDNFIAEGTELKIEVWGDQEEPWVKTKTVGAGGFTIAGGKVTNVQLNNSNWEEPLFWAGDGTSSDPYIIKTAYHLGNVKTVMRANPTTGLYFQLANDIDLEDAVWEQVNLVHTPYTIHFDGGNHTISSFSIAQNTMGLSSFFGEIGGEVKDLAFSNATIETGGSNGSAGVLCGIANGLTVTNVDATDVDITITNNCGETTGVGGLIGYAVNSTISGCDLTGCDIDLNGTDTQNVGGLIGRLRAEASSVTGCSVASATIVARYCAGGLIGKLACTSGPVNVKGNTVTGMNVSYVGDDSGTLSGAGGLIGAIQAAPTEPTDPAIVVNIGAADAANTVTGLTISQTPGYAGGLVGYLRSGDMTFVNNSVAGTITSDGEYVGGFIGRSRSDGTYDNCSFNGSVTGAYFVGGLFGGDEDYREYTMNNCHSEGSVEATSHYNFYDDASFVGGLIGLARSEKADGIVLTACWSSADVTGNLGYVGGLIGDSVGVTLGEKVGETITAAKACEYKNGTITGHGDSGNTKASAVGGLVALTRGSYVTKIYGGKLTSATVYGANYVGGILGYNTRADLVIEGCNVSSPTQKTKVTSTRYYIGGILGCTSANVVNISHCDVNADIEGVAIVGGIFSYNYSSVINIAHCTVAGSVKATGTASSASQTWSHVGGISAFAYQKTSKIEYCEVTADITGQIAAGGIVGRNIGSTFDHCTYSSGTISANSYVGGISGANTKDTSDNDAPGTFSYCTVSNGAIIKNTGDYTGGILGRNFSENTSISNCEVSASFTVGAQQTGGIAGQSDVTWSITSCKADISFSASKKNGQINLGGILGNQTGGSVTITSCKSTVNATHTEVSGGIGFGGIVGRVNNCTANLSSCTSSGTLTVGRSSSGEAYVGGLIGLASNGNAEKSSSSMTIIGNGKTQRTGGLIGAVYSGNFTVDQCVFSGTITNPGTQSGGLIGEIQDNKTATVTNCCFSGSLNVTAGGYSAAICGYPRGNINLSNSFAMGSVKVGTSGSNGNGGLIGGFADATTSAISGNLNWLSSFDCSVITDTGVTIGAIVGRTITGVTLSNNYRKNALNFTTGNGYVLTDNAAGKDGSEVASDVSCQDKASALGWDSTIWKLDNTDGFPTLINLPE